MGIFSQSTLGIFSLTFPILAWSATGQDVPHQDLAVVEDVVVNIPQEEWALWEPDQSNIRGDVILKTSRNLAPIDSETQHQ